MSKPLQTDDVIEQAKRGEIDLEEHPYYEDYDQEFYDEDYEADKTEDRVDNWLERIRPELKKQGRPARQNRRRWLKSHPGEINGSISKMKFDLVCCFCLYLCYFK